MKILTSRASEQTRIDRFQVFGERRSGTNAVEQLLARNTLLQPVRDFGWKHGFPGFPVLPKCCLFVVVVRDPFDWLKSIHAAPFEAAPELRGKGFSEFIRTEWRSLYTPQQSGWQGHGYEIPGALGEGEELQSDRHPITGKRFANVIELRRYKLSAHTSLLMRGLNAVLVRYEDFLDNRAAVLGHVVQEFDLQTHDRFDPVNQKADPVKGAAGRNRNVAITDADRAFILSNLSAQQERSLGYLPANFAR